MTTNTPGTRVKGHAAPGDYVTYFDIANQTGEIYKVTGPHTTMWGTSYALTNARTGVPHFTDLRQHGWTFTEAPADAIELAVVTFQDGNTAEIPANLAKDFQGLHNGYIIINSEIGNIGLTACCAAGAKGCDGYIGCRNCYEEIDPDLGGPMDPSFPFIAAK